MKRIKSKNLKYLNFELINYECLIYYDGPILAKYNDINGRIFLVLWVDYNYKMNRWLYFNISKDDYDLYNVEINDLHDIVKNSNELYLIDIDATGNFKRVYSISIDELPNEYLPNKKTILQQ